MLEGQVDPGDVYERDTAWIRACDALVAEVSTPSHGVGYEVAYALSLGKPVLCVYRTGAADFEDVEREFASGHFSQKLSRP